MRWPASRLPGSPPGTPTIPFAQFGDETDDGRALRQLKVLDAVVGGTIALELGLLDRSLALACRINGGVGGGRQGPKGLAMVMLVDSNDRVDTVDGDSPLASSNLLSGRRREVLQRTLNAWEKAVAAVASIIRGDAEGELGDQ